MTGFLQELEGHCKDLVHNTLEVSKRNDKETVSIKHSQNRMINTLQREMMSSGQVGAAIEWIGPQLQPICQKVMCKLPYMKIYSHNS